MKSRCHICCLLLGLVFAACSGTRAAWTVPADLAQGNPDQMVTAAAGVGQLPALLEQDETQLLDTDQERMAQFLRAALASGSLSKTDAETAEWMLHDVCELNAPGTPAADFRFATAEASENTLLTFMPGTPLCLLFYDPDCGHCSEVIDQLTVKLPRHSDTQVLAVCIESTPKRWEQTREALPADWVRAYDRSDIMGNDIYMIRSMPSIYLLDPERRVVLKNPTVEQLVNAISQQ